MNWQSFIWIGSSLCGLGVGLGAFGAHGLKNTLSTYAMDVYEKAVTYQMYHGLAILAVAFIASRMDTVLVRMAGLLFLAGVILFSGSLYVLALTGVKWLGAITPLGGLSFLAGWVLLAYSALRSQA